MRTLITLFLSFFLCVPALAEIDLSTERVTDNGYFHASYTSKLAPIEINTLHAWIIHIKDKEGNDIANAEVSVIGGMPEHNHGLPTQPQVTKNIGNGCYLLEGMKFHMLGWWTITLSITNDDVNDTVTFNLKL
ncbi:MAG: FixH family protein [Gammaproteobacteria bacterium]